MWHIWKDLMRIAQRMGPEEFFMLVLVVVVISLICLKGFGSRSSY